MTYEKTEYRVAPCYCKKKRHHQVEVYEIVDGVGKWTALAFHLSKRDAEKLQQEWQAKLEHEKSCPIRISWPWNSSTPVEKRMEIDRWYNSLSSEHRGMVSTIVSDLREELTWR
jgi:hypothetical protein